MSMVPVPGDTACLEAMRLFLADLFPSAPAYRTQENRVAEPSDPNFVMMTPTAKPRLGTNVLTMADCAFVASIAPTVPPDGTGTMTVTEMRLGAILVGATVFGADVVAGTAVTEQVSGTGGGVGVYRVDEPQTVASEIMASGALDRTQKIQLEIQLDFYGPLAGDNALAFSTMFRDEYATSFFAGIAPAIVPLYGDDPRQAVFVSEEQQFQGRWTARAQLDVDAVVSVPQQFADALDIGVVNVDAEYPPT